MTDLTDTIKELRKLPLGKLEDATVQNLQAAFTFLPMLLDAAEKAERYEKALNAAIGYLHNAKIDLETGCPKKTALNTLQGSINLLEKELKESEK